MSGFELHAWVDESMHSAPDGRPGDGMYVLAAAVADPAACEPVRERLVHLVPSGKQRLHWRDEDDALRRQMAGAVGSCDLAHVVVVGSRFDNRRQERARRRCMERLFFQLESLEVSRVTLESRTASLNKRDQEMFAALRGCGAMRGLRAEFGLPSAEPMLWVPDVVAGAVGLDRRGMGSEPLESIAASLEIIDITV